MRLVARLLVLLPLLWVEGVLASDADGDGIEDGVDNCPTVVNVDQTDADSDGSGNACDAFPLDSTEQIDSDQDGLGANLESQIGTDDELSDTDGDSLSDYLEYTRAETDPRLHDTDFDGLWDDEEQRLGTDPTKKDTDGDGAGDGEELAVNSDPLSTSENRRRRWQGGFRSCCPGYPSSTGVWNVALSDDATKLAFYNLIGQIEPVYKFERIATSGSGYNDHREWLAGAWGSVAVSGDGSQYAQTNGDRIRTSYIDSAAYPEDTQIPGYFGSGFASLSFDYDGDTLSASEYLDYYKLPTKIKVFRWTGFQWIQKGLSFDGYNYSKLSSSGDSILLHRQGTAKIYSWSSVRWVQSGGEINSPIGGRLTDASSDLDVVVFADPQADRGSPQALNVGKVVVMRRVDDSWEQVGNQIEGERAFDLIGGATINDAGTRVLVWSLGESHRYALQGNEALRLYSAFWNSGSAVREYELVGNRWKKIAESDSETFGVGYASDANLKVLLVGGGFISLDEDGDQLGFYSDAFPSDHAASSDFDGDGYPDGWNSGYTQADSTTGLKLDAFPEDPADWNDSDTDGLGDNYENSIGTDPADADSDDDSLTDFEEVVLGTSPILRDTDDDGVADGEDVFPLDQSEWIDTDGDGVGDNGDAFPQDPTEQEDEDADGLGANFEDQLGTSDNDSDSDDDGLSDYLEYTSGLSNPLRPDTDNDGVKDGADFYPNISLGDRADDDGDGRPNECDAACEASGMSADLDDDNDGVTDLEDDFPLDENESIDTDSDGIGNNADTDDDNDGVADDSDSYPLISLEGRADYDGDGIPNDCDQVCIDVGMSADDDDDNDGVTDSADAFPLDENESLDTDSDGIGNNADTDDDNDGVPDSQDDLPLDATESVDTDSDGIGNNADTDDDNDGLSDVTEAELGTDPLKRDTDGDGWSDKEEVEEGADPLLATSQPELSSGLPIWLLYQATQ